MSARVVVSVFLLATRLLCVVSELDDVGPEIRQAVLLKNAGHAIKAEAILRTVLHQHPGNIAVKDELGLVLQAQGRREEALLQFKEILKKDPTNAGVYSNMGICLEAMERDDEALAAFRKAIELQPDLRSAHVDIANFYRYHNNPAKAIRHLKRAIEITPSDPIAHGGLGAVLSDMKRWDEAEKQYRTLLEIAPNNVHGITELGNVLLRQGHLDRAIAHFERAMEKSHGKWVRAMDGLARAYREKGDLKEAEKYAQMAVKMRPVDTQSRDVLASVYLAEGHTKRAAQQYATALKYNPQDEVAKKKMPTLVVIDKDDQVALHSSNFPGVDLSSSEKDHLPERDEIHQESGSEPEGTLKSVFIGLFAVAAVAALAVYLRCCGPANESRAMYTPINSEEESFGRGSDNMYQL